MIDERDEIENMRLQATLLKAPKKIVLTVKRLYSVSSGIILNKPHYEGRGLLVDLDSIKQREAFTQNGRRLEFTTINWFDVNGKDMGWIPADVFFL